MSDSVGPVGDPGRPRLPTASVVLATAEAAGWPTVRFSDALTIEGEEGWRSACARAGALVGELRRLLDALGAPWVTAELLATAPARDRLRQWFAAGARVPTPDDLVRKLRYLGDDEIRSVLLNALHERIPPPAAAFLLDHAFFAGVGWSAGGWTMQAALPGESVAFVLLSGASRNGADVLDIVLHEAAHAWLLRTPSEPLRAEEMYHYKAADLLAAASRPEEMATWLSRVDETEKQADALARTWGGHLCHSHESGRAYTVETARALVETFGSR